MRNSLQYENRLQLTKREKEVLYLIAEEYTNKEIAKLLYISQNTVNTYRKSLLLKFSARNIAGVIRRSFENGILPVKKPNFKFDLPPQILKRFSF